MLNNRDDWQWDMEAAFHPLFQAEAKRRELLRAKAVLPATGTDPSALTPMEARELADGYLPYAYLGATYHGHPVTVVRLMDGSNDRTPILNAANNPNRWINLWPPLSPVGWPEGPPGFVLLEPGVHWDPMVPLPRGRARFWVLPPPWDIEFSRQLLGV